VPTNSQVPSFNLKVVVQQTGVKPDTLRAWERRYGLPQPKRSDGNHRLYSQRDVYIIKWLISRQQEGMRIKQAVELWRRLEARGQDPLLMTMSTQILSPSEPRAGGNTIIELCEDWIDACLAFDEQRAEQVLSQAFALYHPKVVCVELLQRGIARISEGWYRGEVTVQQEHFASELAMRRLEALVMATPAPTRPGRILIGCPPEEEHTFGLLLLTFLLRRLGWQVLYLGANVPVARMETTTLATRPQLVILAAQQLHTAASLLEMAQLLQQEGVPLAFGGGIFNRLPALRDRIPGHFLGERLDLSSQVVEKLMATYHPLPVAESLSVAYHQAQGHYCERQVHIEVHLFQSLQLMDIPHEYLARTNAELGRNIVAALKLGDMDFLDTDTRWVKDLLNGYQPSADRLHAYLEAYYQAARIHLGERGDPIVTWLAKQIAKI